MSQNREGVFRHLLIPLDGSKLGEAVLPMSVGLAAGLGARVTLLHVLERGAPEKVHGEPHLLAAPAADDYLRDAAQRYARSGVAIDYHVHPNQESDVAGSIVQHAGELRADLIVLTPHGPGDVRRWLLGSIPQMVLQRGTTPVLFVPAPAKGGEGRPFQLTNILVPLSGHAADIVLNVAQELASTFGANATLVRVVPTLGTMRGEEAATALLVPSAARESLNMQEESAHSYLSGVAREWVPAAPERPRQVVVRGEPAQAILGIIQTSNPDLTIMSTHGKSGLSGLWAASTAARVVARSTSPLLLMRVMTPEE